jgi:hypothetical protein
MADILSQNEINKLLEVIDETPKKSNNYYNLQDNQLLDGIKLNSISKKFNYEFLNVLENYSKNINQSNFKTSKIEKLLEYEDSIIKRKKLFKINEQTKISNDISNEVIKIQIKTILNENITLLELFISKDFNYLINNNNNNNNNNESDDYSILKKIIEKTILNILEINFISYDNKEDQIITDIIITSKTKDNKIFNSKNCFSMKIIYEHLFNNNIKQYKIEIYQSYKNILKIQNNILSFKKDSQFNIDNFTKATKDSLLSFSNIQENKLEVLILKKNLQFNIQEFHSIIKPCKDKKLYNIKFLDNKKIKFEIFVNDNLAELLTIFMLEGDITNNLTLIDICDNPEYNIEDKIDVLKETFKYIFIKLNEKDIHKNPFKEIQIERIDISNLDEFRLENFISKKINKYSIVVQLKDSLIDFKKNIDEFQMILIK